MSYGFLLNNNKKCCMMTTPSGTKPIAEKKREKKNPWLPPVQLQRERKRKKWTEEALLLQLLSNLYAPDKLLSSDLFCDLAKAKSKELSFQEEGWWNRQKHKDNFVGIISFVYFKWSFLIPCVKEQISFLCFVYWWTIKIYLIWFNNPSKHSQSGACTSCSEG